MKKITKQFLIGAWLPVMFFILWNCFSLYGTSRWHGHNYITYGFEIIIIPLLIVVFVTGLIVFCMEYDDKNVYG